MTDLCNAFIYLTLIAEILYRDRNCMCRWQKYLQETK